MQKCVSVYGATISESFDRMNSFYAVDGLWTECWNGLERRFGSSSSTESVDKACGQVVKNEWVFGNRLPKNPEAQSFGRKSQRIISGERVRFDDRQPRIGFFDHPLNGLRIGIVAVFINPGTSLLTLPQIMSCIRLYMTVKCRRIWIGCVRFRRSLKCNGSAEKHLSAEARFLVAERFFDIFLCVRNVV